MRRAASASSASTTSRASLVSSSSKAVRISSEIVPRILHQDVDPVDQLDIGVAAHLAEAGRGFDRLEGCRVEPAKQRRSADFRHWTILSFTRPLVRRRKMRIGAQPGSAGRLQPGRPSEARTAIELRRRDETVVDLQRQIPFEVRWREGIQCLRSDREPRRAGEQPFEFGKFMRCG